MQVVLAWPRVKVVLKQSRRQAYSKGVKQPWGVDGHHPLAGAELLEGQEAPSKSWPFLMLDFPKKPIQSTYGTGNFGST